METRSNLSLIVVELSPVFVSSVGGIRGVVDGDNKYGI
jgi:hypothetical protein